MKSRTLILSSLLFSCLSASAAYKYMEFQLVDGTTHCIEAEGLSIAVDDGQLIAVNASENVKLKAEQVSAMEFVDVLSVDEIIATAQGAVTVYSLSGHNLGNFSSIKDAQAALSSGIFLVKTSMGETLKIKVEK